MITLLRNSLARLRIRLLEYRTRKIFEKQFGKSCRYSFTGGNMTLSFTAPVVMNEKDMARMLRDAANALEEPGTQWGDY